MGGVYWFRIVDREAFVRRLTYLAADGLPYDLTGYSAQFTIEIPGTVILTAASGSGITLGGATGTIDINVPASAFAAALPFTSANYSLMLTPPGGSPRCLVSGQFSKGGQL
jgi:hypothetical protein